MNSGGRAYGITSSARSRIGSGIVSPSCSRGLEVDAELQVSVQMTTESQRIMGLFGAERQS